MKRRQRRSTDVSAAVASSSEQRTAAAEGLTLTQEILSQHGFEFGLFNPVDGGAEFRIGFR